MTDITSISSIKQAVQPVDQRLLQTAQAFEAIFLRDMIKSMRSSELGNELLDSGASNQFRDMMDGRLADKMSVSGGGLGIAKMLIDEWSKRDE